MMILNVLQISVLIVNGEFGKYLKTNISRIRKNSNNLFYGVIKLKNKRCIFLNKNNLCNIYIYIYKFSRKVFMQYL